MLPVFKCLFRPAGQRLNCGHPFHPKEGRRTRIRWTLNQNPRCVRYFCPRFWTVGNPIYSELYLSWKAVHTLPITPTKEFFLLTANDEVIVYFPTGGFLGDSSLSARLWHSLQFLPSEWKVGAKVWLHVGNGLTCVRLCVLHTCAHFPHIHYNSHRAPVWSLSLKCLLDFLGHYVIGQSGSCTLRHWNYVPRKQEIINAWAIFGGISVFAVWRMNYI